MTATTAPGTPAKSRSPLLLVGAALAIVYVVWGSTYLAIRIMVEEMPPFVSAGVRFLAAGLLVGGALAVRAGLGRLAVTRRQLLGCAQLLQSTATSLAATYAYVNPLVAVCLGWLILAEPVTVPTLGGGVIVVLAVAVVVRSEFQR